ncbi:MAG: CDP-glycerol glycerophosphotransferase family protein [Candidatus Zixiibacteriota bacterium]|nr:MAG: CDP-glycerol glycerophosphotransferase family protein [candidate division Zixibacteria bacterium]
MRVRRNVFDFLILIALFPVYLLGKLIPKDNRLYVFGSSLGYHFADNSKYLFLYANENVKNITSVFISKNRRVVGLLRSNNMQAEFLYSFAGLRTVMRAKKAFLSHSLNDIHPLLLGGAQVIQLWHGTPLKKIGNDANWISENTKAFLKNMVRKASYALFPYLYGSNRFDFIVASSQFLIPSYMSAFGIDKTRISVAGQPRNDCLSGDFVMNTKIFSESQFLRKLRDDWELVISWLPTYRKPAPTSIVNLLDDYGFSEREVNKRLRDLKAVLVIKPHFLELDLLNEYLKDSSNIQVYNHADPYPLIRYTDILITDYSSVYFDYLLVGKPMIFTPFDMPDYVRRNAGFYYDYDEVTPGPKCTDWRAVIDEIEKTARSIRTGTDDPYLESRAKVKALFNAHDSNFSKRIVDHCF